MAEVIWTKLATGQFERAVKYIQAEQGTYYASIVLNKIIEATRSLEKFPEMGQVEPL